MEERKTDQKQHSIVIKDRTALTATGIEDVESFDDDKIIA